MADSSHIRAQKQAVNNLLILPSCQIIEEFSKTASDRVFRPSSFKEDLANWKRKNVFSPYALFIPSVMPATSLHHQWIYLDLFFNLYWSFFVYSDVFHFFLVIWQNGCYNLLCSELQIPLCCSQIGFKPQRRMRTKENIHILGRKQATDIQA